MTDQPRVLMIAGPNGAGKTTFARSFLPNEAHTLTFLNADEMAAGLSPLNPSSMNQRAAKLLLLRIDECVAQRETFSIETTLSGLNYRSRIQDWRRQGYLVKLFFLWLPSADVAVARVAHRVSLGGHDIPEDVIRRRFERGWENFQMYYKQLVDEWQIYDATPTPAILLHEGGRR